MIGLTCANCGNNTFAEADPLAWGLTPTTTKIFKCKTCNQPYLINLGDKK